MMAKVALVAQLVTGTLGAHLLAADAAGGYALDAAAKEEARAGSLSFPAFVTAFDRDYAEGSEEYESRRALYQERAAAVREHNQRPDRTWHATINHFSDHTEAEFSMYRGRRGWGGPSGSSGSSFLQGGEGATAVNTSSSGSCAPPKESVDWGSPKPTKWSVEAGRPLESLKSVRNQGGCGSCWAIATSVLLTAKYEIANKKNDRSFSAQEIVECTPNEKFCGGSGGCGGATMELALAYVEANGLGDEKSMPYTASSNNKESCPRSGGKAGASSAGSTPDGAGEVGRVYPAGQSSYLQNLRGYGDGSGLGGHTLGLRSWKKLEENKQEPLMQALMDGPVGISAAASAWGSYGDGVLNSCDKDAIVDHAVVAIGYGTDSKGGKFWNIRNSWGEGWGEGGNIRISRLNTDVGEEGHCGVDHQPKDGTACKPYPDKVDICGMCGILYDSVTADFDKLSK